jgi:hypothetical protein
MSKAEMYEYTNIDLWWLDHLQARLQCQVECPCVSNGQVSSELLLLCISQRLRRC